MLPILMFATCTDRGASAKDAAAADNNPAAAVESVRQQVDQQSNELEAIAQFLEDRELVALDKAPPGWIQPDLDAYKAAAASGQIVSFVPGQVAATPADASVPVAPAATTTTSAPKESTSNK